MKERIKHPLLFIFLVVIDQASKLWVRTVLANRDPIVIIPKILKLQYHTNNGAVWGIMGGRVPFLIIFTIIVLALIIYLYFKVPQNKRYNILRIILIFIMAGAIGNMIDRVCLGYVVDFIYFEIIDFPLFNVADSFLTVSAVLLLLLALFYYKEEDLAFLDSLFKKKKVDNAQNDKNDKNNDNE